ncbi:MAG TPA: hypothetical protein VKV26_13435 [Dehalococcoidia bacterium]|nr:hypothetical protein [Dehalococcoidia bacterium]
MLDLSRTQKLAVPLAALALLAACSSSNNKNKANNAAANAPVATTVAAAASATTAATTAAASATAARTATAAPTVAAAGSSTPAGSSVTNGRSPTPAAEALAGSCSGPAAGGAAAAAGTPAAGASADEKLLRDAALTLAELPKGYAVDTAESSPPSDPDMTANFETTFTCIGQGGTGLNIQAVVDGLFAFKDAATTAAGFKELPAQITQSAGEDFQLKPVPNAPKIGDEAIAYQVSGSTQGITLGGYAVIWRHGRFGASVIQVGAPASGTIDDVAALAQKQDAKLQSNAR